METKKNSNKDVYRNRTLFLLIGLCASLSLTLAAFEYKTITSPPPFFPEADLDHTIFDEPPITYIEPQKPLQMPKLIELDNDEDIPIDLPPFIFDQEPTEIDLSPPTEIIEQKAEKATDPFIVLEKEASFPGGKEAWAKFLSKNLRYPRQAQKMGIEGRVILNFYVDEQGEISNITAPRGIGGGCDEEAIRVLSKSPKWNPGKQRGRPVKSPHQIVIVFRMK